MGSSLGSVMVNIIMRKLEDKIIKPLVNNGTFQFTCWYVNDTLVNGKPQKVSCPHKFINPFDKNLQFIADLFENNSLDLEILPNEISVHLKDTKQIFYLSQRTT